MNKKYLVIIFLIITIFSLGGFFVHAFINKEKLEEVTENQETEIDDENSEEQTVYENQSSNVRIGEISESEYLKNIQSEKKDITKIENTEDPKIAKKYKPFDFVVIADSESYKATGGHEEKFESVLAKATSYKPDFAVFSGDIVIQSGPDVARIKNIKNLIERHFEKYYIAFGKHDVECGASCVDVWESVFFNKKYKLGETRKLYHSFDYENTHFVLLSSDYPIKHAVDDEQLAWLNTDLKNNDKSNVIVVVHVPPVTFFKESAKENHDMTYNVVQRDKLLAILNKYKVDLVISGHEHVFDHKVVDGIDYVLAGAVGKSKRYKDSIWKDSFLYITVSGNRIVLKSFGLDGELIREIRVK